MKNQRSKEQNQTAKSLGIREGKQRYAVTLTIETVNQVKNDLDFLGLPPSLFSGLLDEMLSKTAPTIHLLAEKKRVGEKVEMKEIYALMLAQLAFDE